LFSKLCK
jgi:tetratricopeptide (TPR) repeat protein